MMRESLNPASYVTKRLKQIAEESRQAAFEIEHAFVDDVMAMLNVQTMIDDRTHYMPAKPTGFTGRRRKTLRLNKKPRVLKASDASFNEALKTIDKRKLTNKQRIELGMPIRKYKSRVSNVAFGNHHGKHKLKPFNGETLLRNGDHKHVLLDVEIRTPQERLVELLENVFNRFDVWANK